MKIAAVVCICNIVSFGFACWAIIDQYPHPDESGVIALEVLMVLTPILSVVALFRQASFASSPSRQ